MGETLGEVLSRARRGPAGIVGRPQMHRLSSGFRSPGSSSRVVPAPAGTRLADRVTVVP